MWQYLLTVTAPGRPTKILKKKTQNKSNSKRKPRHIWFTFNKFSSIFQKQMFQLKTYSFIVRDDWFDNGYKTPQNHNYGFRSVFFTATVVIILPFLKIVLNFKFLFLLDEKIRWKLPKSLEVIIELAILLNSIHFLPETKNFSIFQINFAC